MPQSLLQTAHESLLNRVHKASPAKANLDGNFVHTSAQFLRKAIDKTGMNQDEAMRALGFTHKGQFCELLDGTRKLWTHTLLRTEAASIRRELLILTLLEEGTCEVERVVRIKESA